MLEIFALRLDRSPLADLYLEFLCFIDDDNRARLARFARREDALRTLYGDLLVRFIAGPKIGIPAKDIRFSRMENGKPYLSDAPHLHFNISHSGDWAAGAFDDQPVGLDVEKIAPLDLDAAGLVFSPPELQELESIRAAERLSYFYTIWTLKESWSKAAGEGLSRPFPSLTFEREDEPAVFRLTDGVTGERSYLKKWDLDPDHRMAVCARHKDFPSRVGIINPFDLFRTFCLERP
jgi:4'-phosphopantetheinyl transferase